MISRIRHISFDCRNPYLLASFWKEVTSLVDDPEDPNEPDDAEALIIDPSGTQPGLHFIGVPELEEKKNRVHLDLEPFARRDDSVDRLTTLGATVVDDRRNDDGTGWVVMADPEGNEFCVERSATERAQPDRPNRPSSAPMRPFPDVRTADERTLLDGLLQWYREGVIGKVAGLSDEAARRRIVGSESTIAGIVKHLTLVEHSWFHVRFAGEQEAEPWVSVDWDADPDWEFRTARSDAIDELVAGYRAEIERSRLTTDAASLDDVSTGSGAPFTLRFLLVHMIEETARHLGHLDILRELTDGDIGE